MNQKPNSRRAASDRVPLPPGVRREEDQLSADPLPIGPSRAKTWAVCGFLVLAIALVFGQTVLFDFVNYDDGVYVHENRLIARGLDVDTVAWAFTTTYGNMWAPLTWLSWLLDAELYGTSAWGFHLTNVLLHAATSVLLFLVLRAMTGAHWPSAIAAMVFAIHPVQVESVAWVAERKGLLAGLFFVLILGAYLQYVRRPTSRRWYWGVVVLYALGLMTKPVLVTLPFVLLLLNFWPLSRPFTIRLLREKIPLFLLAIAACIATPLSQGEAIVSLGTLPLPTRAANAVVAYVDYLRQFFCPQDLSAAYRHPMYSVSAWKVGAALLILAGVSAAVLANAGRRRYLAVGWFWFLGMLVPVIGLVQVGVHARADRYMYLPMVGLCLALAWAGAEVVHPWRARGPWLAIAATLGIGALMVAAWCQTLYWHDSETLWNHAIDCDPKNPVAHGNLGTALMDQNRLDDATTHLQIAVDLNNEDAGFLSNLGAVLMRQGRTDEAMPYLQRSLLIGPKKAQVLLNLGVGYAIRGRLDEAIDYFEKAEQARPDSASIEVNLAAAFAQLGRFDKAATHYKKAVELQPNVALAHLDFAHALAELGRFDEATTHCRQAIVLAKQQGLDALATTAEQRLELLSAKKYPPHK